MTVFAVIAPSFNEQLEKAVKDKFPDRWYEIVPGQYLVSVDKMTGGQIMEKLGLAEGSRGRAMILRLGSYTGWHAKDMWEWIADQATPPAPPPPDVPSTDNE